MRASTSPVEGRATNFSKDEISCPAPQYSKALSVAGRGKDLGRAAASVRRPRTQTIAPIANPGVATLCSNPCWRS